MVSAWVIRSLAHVGVDVTLNGSGDASEIERLRSELATETGTSVTYSAADMTKPEQIEQMVRDCEEQFGGVDILVNNAGIQLVSPVDEFPGDKWEQILSINLSSNFYTIKAALPGMKQRNWGRVINIASLMGWSLRRSSQPTWPPSAAFWV